MDIRNRQHSVYVTSHVVVDFEVVAELLVSADVLSPLIQSELQKEVVVAVLLFSSFI